MEVNKIESDQEQINPSNPNESIPEAKLIKPNQLQEEKEATKKTSIPDTNSFAKTLSSIPKNEVPNLDSNTCPEILKASEIINSKFPYPSQFPNLTKIKSSIGESREPKKSEESNISEDLEKVIKKGGKRLKKRSKKNKKYKKQKTYKKRN
jgi:hypothetical protein